MNRLTIERILELGFTEKEWIGNKYFYNNGFSLFPCFGAYVVGWSLGLPTTGDYDSEMIPIISTEKELRATIDRIDYEIPLKD